MCNSSNGLSDKCPKCHGDITHGSGRTQAVIPNGKEIEKQLGLIQRALRLHHLSLDNHNDQAMSAQKLVDDLETILVMPYEPGKMAKYLSENPSSIPLYNLEQAKDV